MPFRASTVDVLRGFAGTCGYVAVDGLDRAFEEPSFKAMATLVQFVRTGGDGSPWRLVVTCQTSEWPRLLGRLAELNAAVSWRSVNLGDLSDEELREVARRFPRTAPLTLRPGLREVIRSPKLLDVLIGLRPDESGPDEVSSLTGESDLADCFWERMVRRSEQADSRVRYAVCP